MNKEQKAEEGMQKQTINHILIVDNGEIDTSALFRRINKGLEKNMEANKNGKTGK